MATCFDNGKSIYIYPSQVGILTSPVRSITSNFIFEYFVVLRLGKEQWDFPWAHPAQT